MRAGDKIVRGLEHDWGPGLIGPGLTGGLRTWRGDMSKMRLGFVREVKQDLLEEVNLAPGVKLVNTVKPMVTIRTAFVPSQNEADNKTALQKRWYLGDISHRA